MRTLTLLVFLIILIFTMIMFSSCSNERVSSNGIIGVYYLNARKVNDEVEKFNQKDFTGAIEIGEFIDTHNLYIRHLQVKPSCTYYLLNIKITLNSRITDYSGDEMFMHTSLLTKKETNKYYFQIGLSELLLISNGKEVILSNRDSNDYLAYYHKLKQRTKRINERDFIEVLKNPPGNISID